MCPSTWIRGSLFLSNYLVRYISFCLWFYTETVPILSRMSILAALVSYAKRPNICYTKKMCNHRHQLRRQEESRTWVVRFEWLLKNARMRDPAYHCQAFATLGLKFRPFRRARGRFASTRAGHDQLELVCVARNTTIFNVHEDL